MGVAVLRPQDCLKGPFSHETLNISPHMRRPSRNPSPNPNSNSNRTQSNRRKQSPTGTGGGAGGTIHNRSPPRRTMVAKLPATAKSLVMGQVKILRRGEDLNQTASDRAPDVAKIENNQDPVDLVLSSTDRLGPDPNMVPKFYAGSAFITSPPPSSLPLPGFFTKNCVFAKNDDATTDLRRILRLDVIH